MFIIPLSFVWVKEFSPSCLPTLSPTVQLEKFEIFLRPDLAMAVTGGLLDPLLSSAVSVPARALACLSLVLQSLCDFFSPSRRSSGTLLVKEFYGTRH